MHYFGEALNLNTAAIISIALFVGFFTLIRGRADVWKSNYEGEKTRADDLQQKYTELKERVAQLEAAPNVDKLFLMMQHHEDRAAKRNKEVVKVLQQMTKKLGQ